MEIEPASLFATLGHSQRLAIFRLLMRRYPDRLAAVMARQTPIWPPGERVYGR